MAKLNKQMQKQTESAESSGFEPIPDGSYHLRLRDVDATREGPAGPYWSWEFEIVEEGPHKNRRLWVNTSLSEKAAFKMKETFEAFGASLDTDTDDLMGQVVKGVVTQRVIQEGNRKGEITNDIARLKPKDEDFVTPDAEPATDDIFA